MPLIRKRRFMPNHAALYVPTALPATTTWNPSDKNAGITLSGGSLIATTTGNQSVRSISSHSSGKYYYELVWTTKGGTASSGLATAGYTLSGFIGGTTNAVGWLTDGRLILNSSQIASVGSTNTNIVRGVAIDLDNMKMWFRSGSATWIGGGDPATNSGGTSISGLAAGPYLAIGNGETSGDSFTVNFGGSAYSWTPPSGFGDW